MYINVSIHTQVHVYTFKKSRKYIWANIIHCRFFLANVPNLHLKCQSARWISPLVTRVMFFPSLVVGFFLKLTCLKSMKINQLFFWGLVHPGSITWILRMMAWEKKTAISVQISLHSFETNGWNLKILHWKTRNIYSIYKLTILGGL